MSLTIQRFFQEHPEHWDGVKRASFAYHFHHRRPNAHYFAGSWREASCRWCGRTREDVRWEDRDPECKNRPAWADQSVESIIASEEILFEKVLDRAKKIAAEIDTSTLDGEQLSYLHHTHGVDPSMLEVALMDLGKGSLPQRLHDEYQVAYQKHKETGKRGLVRPIVSAKIL